MMINSNDGDYSCILYVLLYFFNVNDGPLCLSWVSYDNCILLYRITYVILSLYAVLNKILNMITINLQVITV